MIRPRDSLRLAYTKLRARRIRLAITIVISGLLFTVLIAGSLVVRGLIAGFESFSEEGFGKRYIVTAQPVISLDLDRARHDSEVVGRAKKLHAELIARKKAEAKKLGIAYDEKTEPPVLEDADMSGTDEQVVSYASEAGTQAVAEYQKKHPAPGLADLKAVGDRYGAIGYYTQNAPKMFPLPYLQVLKDGKEEYKQSGNPFELGNGTGTDSFSGSWSGMDSALIKNFLLPGQKAEVSADGSLPVFVPYTAAQELLKLPKLSGTANATEKLERLKVVRSKLGGFAYTVCYRNSTSADAVQQAIQQQAEITRGKKDKDYIMPSLIYTTPDKPCAAPKLQKDTRTVAEKDQAAKELKFRQTFGEAPPESATLKFHVVGVVPDPPAGSSATFVGIVESIISSAILPGWFTPVDAVQQNPIAKKIFEAQGNSAFFGVGGPNQNFVEFSNPDDVRKFIKEQNCDVSFGQGPVDPGKACQEVGKPFYVFPFGTSVALDDAKDFLSKYFRIAVLAVAVVSSIIMMGTVGRIIADSRRETAVFRAIGAKRLDIASIYLLYVLILAAIIVLAAYLAGSAAATYLHNRYAEELTVSTIVSFNASDTTRHMTLYKVNAMDMIYVVGLIAVAAVVSSLPPLILNLRRNPINDMRDER